jgi:MFS family permease
VKIRSAKKRLHYAWIVASVTFLILLVTAGVRATPGVLIVPLESEFGWTSAAISTAIAINLALYGLIGPFAASLMERLGLRRITLMALSLLAVSVGLTTLMTRRWQLILLWGVCVGSGTGFTATVLSAVVVNRWFERNRGLVLGALTAAGATGQLLFLPLMARIIERSGWRLMALGVSGAAIIVFFVVLWLMRDNPSDVGQRTGQKLVIPRNKCCIRWRRSARPHVHLHSGYWPAAFSSAEQVPMVSSGLISLQRVMTMEYRRFARRDCWPSWESSISSVRPPQVG